MDRKENWKYEKEKSAAKWAKEVEQKLPVHELKGVV